jgi:hypothetical protein
MLLPNRDQQSDGVFFSSIVPSSQIRFLLFVVPLAL